MSEHLPFTPEQIASIGDAEDAELWEDIDEAIRNLARPFVLDEGDE